LSGRTVCVWQALQLSRWYTSRPASSSGPRGLRPSTFTCISGRRSGYAIVTIVPTSTVTAAMIEKENAFE
jgi:hypothetical protein